MIFVIGSNPTVNHPVAATWMKNAAKKGAKIVLADPRITDIGRHAWRTLQFRADTDVALLNALIHTVIDEGLVNEDFVARRASNYEALRENVKGYSAEAMAPICGIAAETLREVVATLANPSLIALLLSGVLGGAASGMQTGLDYYFYTHLWGLQPGQLAVLLPLALLGSVIAVFAAPPLSRRFGKKGVMIGLFTAGTVINLTPMTLKLLGLMPPNGSPAIFPILATVAITVATLAIMGFIIVGSMVADIEPRQSRVWSSLP